MNERSFVVVGLTVGGTWGLIEGLRRPDGHTSKLRLNRSIFNNMYLYFCQSFVCKRLLN